MSGVILHSPSVCMSCPCAELIAVKEQVAFLTQELERVLIKEIVPDRKRITRLESEIPKVKESLSQVSAVRTEGTWGIVGKRADVIYSRLLSMPVNGKMPYLTTGDVVKILGVSSYAQAKDAILRCTEKHLDTQVIERGQRKLGITRVENIARN